MKKYWTASFLVVSVLLLACFFSISASKILYASEMPCLPTENTNLLMPIDTPQSFVKNYNGVNDKMFVFVGQKVSLEPLPTVRYSMDACYKATYTVIEKVYGQQFDEDTIEFVVYDHYGMPPFSFCETALLYVSAEDGTYYHEKYTYNCVYKTANGRWAGGYDYKSYKHDNNKNTKIKPEVIDFEKEVRVSVGELDKDVINYLFPKPYYRFENDTAIAVYGNYVEELFMLNRDGVLTARGIF